MCAPGAIGGIEVKGPNVFAGYWRMPDKTRDEFTDDGYFRTGDLGEQLANGYIKIVGRAKDLIITGGLNVYPKEIEERIDALPGVAESAVIGVPDADFGEAVTAVVVAKSGHALHESEIIAALKADIASFKVPKRVHVVESLPRNAMGKVEKKTLRQRYSASVTCTRSAPYRASRGYEHASPCRRRYPSDQGCRYGRARSCRADLSALRRAAEQRRISPAPRR